MLVKCVCDNCGHSYLADDGAGDPECPRCGVGNEGHRNASDIPASPAGAQPVYNDGPGMGGGLGYDDDEYEDDFGFDIEDRFDPQAPPPMVLTGNSFTKGLLIGGLATLLLGCVIGGALAAIRIFVPVVAAAVIALVAGASCRFGFGGRASSQTKMLALFVVSIVVLLGFVGNITGGWLVERLTGTRAVQAREDVNRGIEALERRASLNQDAGTGMILSKQIDDARTLAQLTDPELEDYIWKQQAQVNQPLLAYGKLRVTRGPAIQLGPDSDPIDVPKEGLWAILAAEFLAAVWLAKRGVSP